MNDLDRAIMKCKDCRVFDPDNQPSVAARLDAGEIFNVWSIPNGSIYSWPTGAAPLHTDMAVCVAHDAELAIKYVSV